MKAVMLYEFGPAENLVYETVADPEPGTGQVRVAVGAAGVHQIETAMREGLPIGPPLPDLPSVFGSEVAGTVDAVGPGVDTEWIGTRVVTAQGRPGGYAELAVADLSDVQLVPDGVDLDNAVAMIRTGATTIGVLDIAALTSEDVVLVTSAAGGMGRLLVAHAVELGATVVGAAGGEAKVAAVKEIGADVAVDYRTAGWVDQVRRELGGRDVTVVLDGVGGDEARAAYTLVSDGGRFVWYGASSRDDFAPQGGSAARVRFTDALGQMIGYSPDKTAVDEKRALQAAEEGVFRAHVHPFPLAEAAKAHTAVRNRATTGKVVLIP